MPIERVVFLATSRQYLYDLKHVSSHHLSCLLDVAHLSLDLTPIPRTGKRYRRTFEGGLIGMVARQSSRRGCKRLNLVLKRLTDEQGFIFSTVALWGSMMLGEFAISKLDCE